MLAVLRDAHQPVVPEKRGRLGANAYDYDGYGYRLGQWVTPAGAILPYVIEVWANAKKARRRKRQGARPASYFFVNRTRVIAPLYGSSAVGGIKLWGCGMNRRVELKSCGVPNSIEYHDTAGAVGRGRQ